MNILNNAKMDILLPPSNRLTHAAPLSPFLMTYSQNIPLRYPLTLYRRGEDGNIEWLGFVFCLFYISKAQERRLLMSYPISFIENYRIPIYERLIEESEKIASSLNVDVLEFEGFSSIEGEIHFPSSDNFFGNFNKPDFINTLENWSFKFAEKHACYQIDRSKVKWDYVEEYMSKDLKIYTEPNFFARRKKYQTLCLNSIDYPELIDVSDKTLKKPPDVSERMYFKESHILFLKSGYVEGCLRWAPSRGNRAKIFRMLFNQEVDETIKLDGIFKAAEEIFKDGFNILQIAKISLKDKKIIENFENIGFERVQIMARLEKNMR